MQRQPNEETLHAVLDKHRQYSHIQRVADVGHPGRNTASCTDISAEQFGALQVMKTAPLGWSAASAAACAFWARERFASGGLGPAGRLWRYRHLG
ncbi:MAG: hypothetical protein IPH35_09045 [Rhodoferax sp.]|nr:hypothetical protein [Rhodoferax sp.]